MKKSKPKDLREKSIEELQAMLLTGQADLYNSRRDLVFRRNTDTTSIKVRRHDIARIMTILTEKQKGAKS